MLKFGNKEFRNLQEQVAKNMKDISDIKAGTMVLDEFGIKVVGEETSVANMPTVEDYKENNPDWEYGDAYAIGTEAPYDIYILTRANGNHADDYWFNIGEFPAPGPEGPEGPQGEQGPQGQTGATGANGLSAGFGTVSATATTLDAGESATVSVTASGPDTAKEFSFTFGIPKGQDGDVGTVEWGDIGGDIDDQADLVSALQGKQNNLVSGTNIKTINNESILGSGNITISGGGDVNDVQVNGTSVVTSGVANIDLTGYVDKTTAQDIFATKTFSGTSIRRADIKLYGDYSRIVFDSPNGDGYIEDNNASRLDFAAPIAASYEQAHICLQQKNASNKQGSLSPVGTLDLGNLYEAHPWNNIIMKGVLRDYNSASSNNEYGVKLPSMSSWNANKTLATTDQIPSLTGYATETWVTSQGYITGITSSDVTTALGYTPGTSNFSGAYADLTGKPDLSIYAESADLSAVATSGDYDDLTNKPTIPTVSGTNDGTNWTSITINSDTYAIPVGGGSSGVSDVTLGGTSVVTAGVAILPAYPTIPTTVSSFTNDAGYITSSALNGYATETWVGQQGYLTSVDWSDVTGKPTFATVATTGDYDDLINKPTIPTATSDLTNDSGFITSSSLSNYVTTNTAQTITADKSLKGAELDFINSSDVTKASIYLESNSDEFTVEADSIFLDISGGATLKGDELYLSAGDTGISIMCDNASTAAGAPITIDAAGGAVSVSGSSFTYNNTQVATVNDIPTVPVTDVTVNGTSVVSSGTAAVSVPTSASTTVSASSETFTFTYADGTTTTKTFLTAITSATTTLS